MIRYALRCDREHRFDCWFGSSADFDRLTAAGMIACAVCGSSAVVKDLMSLSRIEMTEHQRPAEELSLIHI